MLLAGAAALFCACCGGGSVPATEVADAAGARSGADAGVSQVGAGDGPLFDPVAAGRALEAGDAARARELMGPVGTSPASRYLGAMIALGLGEHDEAIGLLRGLAGFDPSLEGKRRKKILEALADSGKLLEAADEARAMLLDKNASLDEGDALGLRERMADWLAASGRMEDALAAYEAARKGAKGRNADRIDLERGRTLLKLGGDSRKKEAVKILTGIATSCSSGALMKKAEALLADIGQVPEWTDAQRMERAVVLMEKKAWDEAQKSLEPLLEGEGPNADEAAWLHARLLFKRRRHYSEAVEALEPIVKGGKKHALEAMFLKARALSRLDRDEEAIEVYRNYARKIGAGRQADEARFYACRLEFYLGEHGSALKNLEKLVGSGKGKKLKKTNLGPDTTREAHFLAGMSAILDVKSKRAPAHLEAASRGSTSDEAIERNRYWYSVGKLEAGAKEGAALLQEICEENPSGWYSLHAARRLKEAGLESGACAAAGASQIEDLDGGTEDPAEGEDVKALEDLSATAAFLAGIGLFREAAEHLRSAEKTGKVKAGARDWIANYVALDAPHHAIRRAARGLSWPPKGDDLWQARAAYPTPYESLVREQEEARDLPEDLIYAIARKESLFDPGAVSGVGAMGMMQMMPHTYETNRKRAGLDPLKEGELPGPRDSIKAATCELAHLLELFDGSLPLAIMAYNGGSAAVKRWLDRSGGLPMDVFVEKAGFAQTRNYVRRVYMNLVRYRDLYGGGPVELPAIAALPSRMIEDAGVDMPADAGPEEAKTTGSP